MEKNTWVPRNPKPIIVTEVRPTRNPEIVQLRLEQEQDFNDISGPSMLRSMMLKGASQIQTRPPKIAYESFSKAVVDSLSLVVGSMIPTEVFPGAYISTHEFQEGEAIPEGYRQYRDYVNMTVFAPRTWENEDGSKGVLRPKTAGRDGEVLTHAGKPIYIVRNFTVTGVDQSNKFIQHDNIITRGNNNQAIRARAGEPAANIQSIGNAALGLDRGSLGSENDDLQMKNYKDLEIPSFESQATENHAHGTINRTSEAGKQAVEEMHEQKLEHVGEANGPKLQVATGVTTPGGGNPEAIATDKNQSVEGGRGTEADPVMQEQAEDNKETKGKK